MRFWVTPLSHTWVKRVRPRLYGRQAPTVRSPTNGQRPHPPSMAALTVNGATTVSGNSAALYGGLLAPRTQRHPLANRTAVWPRLVHSWGLRLPVSFLAVVRMRRGPSCGSCGPKIPPQEILPFAPPSIFCQDQSRGAPPSSLLCSLSPDTSMPVDILPLALQGLEQPSGSPRLLPLARNSQRSLPRVLLRVYPPRRSPSPKPSSRQWHTRLGWPTETPPWPPRVAAGGHTLSGRTAGDRAGWPSVLVAWQLRRLDAPAFPPQPRGHGNLAQRGRHATPARAGGRATTYRKQPGTAQRISSVHPPAILACVQRSRPPERL